MKVAFGNVVNTEFLDKVWEVCQDLGWDDKYISWMMAIIGFETAGTFRADIRSGAGSGATGLIQFMPLTAMQLGTTTGLLAKMSAVEQLDYVKQYFEPYKNKINSLCDMYTAVFAPKYVGFPPETVLYSEGAAYRQNAPLDVNTDGKITKEEACYYVQQMLWKGLQPKYSKEYTPKSKEVSKKEFIAEILDELDEIIRKLRGEFNNVK